MIVPFRPPLSALLSAIALAGAADGFAAEKAAQPGLVAGPGATVLREGRPYCGVGVNYFDCFLRTLRDGSDASYDDGFRVLAEHGIPFARFSAVGFWPREMKLYVDDREEYFRRLDGVVRSAERHDVGLIPSLFWHYACAPDLVGEPMDQWGNPESETHAFMRRYVGDVVGRYKDSEAIWAWELGNEFNLACDLPNATEHRPRIVPQLGTALERTGRDELTHAMLVAALRAFGREVRRHDPHRLITSGNSMPRPSAWHNREERTWTKDGPEQFAEMLALTAPDPVSLVSVHCYGENIARLSQAAAVCVELNRPLFVGEFQVEDSAKPGAREAFESFLASLCEHRVPLAAVWVFDFDRQEDEFNISATNDRAWQLEMLGRWNRTLQTSKRP